MAKLQVKRMKLKGEIPEDDSNKESDKNEGEKINQSFQDLDDFDAY